MLSQTPTFAGIMQKTSTLAPAPRRHTTGASCSRCLNASSLDLLYTLVAMSRYRDALVRHVPLAEPRIYPPVPEILTSCFDVLLLPPRPFRTESP